MASKLLSFIILFFCILHDSQAQSYKSQQRQVLGLNLLGNALLGGIGGAINKQKDEKFMHVFLKNFAKGLTGGLVKYSAKYHAYFLNDPKYEFYAPINRLQFFLGHSIVMNASLNKNMLHTCYANFYGVDLRIRTRPGSEKMVLARLSVSTVADGILFGTIGHDINIPKSLLYGQFYFDMHPGVNTFGNFPPVGISGFNCLGITLDNGGPIYQVIPHEVVHTYQNYDLFPLTNFFKPKVEHLYKDIKVYKFLSKYIVLDAEQFYFLGIYLTQPKPVHYKNYYEFEAEHFNRRWYIAR